MCEVLARWRKCEAASRLLQCPNKGRLPLNVDCWNILPEKSMGLDLHIFWKRTMFRVSFMFSNRSDFQNVKDYIQNVGSALDLLLAADNLLWPEDAPRSCGAITADHAGASTTPLGRHCM